MALKKKSADEKMKQIIFYVKREHYSIAMQTINELVKKYR